MSSMLEDSTRSRSAERMAVVETNLRNMKESFEEKVAGVKNDIGELKKDVASLQVDISKIKLDIGGLTFRITLLVSVAVFLLQFVFQIVLKELGLL